jgi:hypothetical protein
MKKILLPVVFFLLAGCVTEKPLVTTPPASAGFSPYTDTLQVDFSLARVSDNTVIYEPDANVKKASYETYIFP